MDALERLKEVGDVRYLARRNSGMGHNDVGHHLPGHLSIHDEGRQFAFQTVGASTKVETLPSFSISTKPILLYQS